jgi:hypothetical protein
VTGGESLPTALDEFTVGYGEEALYLDWLDFEAGSASSSNWSASERRNSGASSDALAYGERTFDEQEAYEWAERVTGRSRSTLRNWAWVARNVPVKSRWPELPWSFHQVVAAKEPERQAELLSLALRWGWSKDDLKAHLDDGTVLPRRLSVDDTCPRCDYGSPVMIKIRRAQRRFGCRIPQSLVTTRFASCC